MQKGRKLHLSGKLNNVAEFKEYFIVAVISEIMATVIMVIIIVIRITMIGIIGIRIAS